MEGKAWSEIENKYIFSLGNKTSILKLYIHLKFSYKVFFSNLALNENRVVT